MSIINIKFAESKKGFTLAEILAVVIIGTMILIAVLNLFGRFKASARSITDKMQQQMLPEMIHQRIAEDLDRLCTPGPDTKIEIENKLDPSGFQICRMVIENQFYDKTNKPKLFEKVTWQTNYDTYGGSLVLYRSHTGLNLEDKIVDKQLADSQSAGSELFIPLIDGITYFAIEVPKITVEKNEFDEEYEEIEYLQKWTDKKMPTSVTVTVSFAPYEESLTGELEIPEDKLYQRTIAIDRTRKIAYQFKKKDLTDPNEIESLYDSLEDDEDSEPNDLTENEPSTER